MSEFQKLIHDPNFWMTLMVLGVVIYSYGFTDFSKEDEDNGWGTS